MIFTYKFKAVFKKYKQFLLFCIVGVSNTIVALIVSWVILKLCGLADFKPVFMGFNIIAGLSSVIGDIAGAINSYILNSKFVFGGRNSKTGPKFIAAFIIYAALSALLVMLVNKVLHVPEDYCKLIVTPVMLVVNYLMNKLWVFKVETGK